MPQYRELADLFLALGASGANGLPVEQAMALVTAASVAVVPGAEEAAVTEGRAGRFRTIASTGLLPTQVDAIQYELMSGPCVDAVVEDTVFRSDDLRTETRWPEFATRAVTETGVISILSFRMFFEDGDLLAGLNLYATKPAVFDDEAETRGLLLATHGALALAGALRLNKIENLERALNTNREIGIAIGILMARHLATREQAFDLLRVASQNSHRKIVDLARDVVETGDLELPTPHERRLHVPHGSFDMPPS